MDVVEKRKWGITHLHWKDDEIAIKTLIIFPGEYTSLQYHDKRDEFWYAVRKTKIVKDGKEILLKKHGYEMIPRKLKHRIIGVNNPSIITEISYGEFSEDDIVRLKDKYGRA